MGFIEHLRSHDMELGEFVREHRRRLVAGAGMLVLAAMLAGAAYWWFQVRWKPPPSIFDTPVDSVLGYLATPDFNRLSMRERMAYIEQFAGRFRGMSQQDSVVAAAFLAGVTGKVRAQLAQNVRVLAKDILAEGAATYVNLPPGERGAFIDAWIVEWMRMAELLATGEPTKRTPEEIVAGAASEAKRNEASQSKRLAGRDLSERGANRFMDFWQAEVEPAASPREMGQITRFMDDMRQRLVLQPKE